MSPDAPNIVMGGELRPDLFTLTGLWDDKLDVSLRFLSTFGEVELVNQPNVTTLNGSTAYVASGDEFSFVSDFDVNQDQNGNVVITPEGRNILRGVSRAYVMQELCVQLGIPVVEKNIEPYDVYTADEAFMTGTPFCMLPVTALNGNAIGLGRAGPVFARLLDRWGKNTGLDTEAQIKRWDAARGESAASHAPTPYRFKTR